MTRVRPGDTALAVLATVLACWPMTTLVAPDTWIPRAFLCVLVVAGVGMLARAFIRSPWLVLLVQVLALVETIALLYGRGHLWYGLPGPDTVLAFNNVLYEARQTIVAYAAPAPTNRGIALGLSMIIGAVALAVDHIAVTRRSPALAGIPLLTAYLVTASNSGEPLSWVSFTAPAIAWFVLIGRQGIESMKRWSTVAPFAGKGDRDAPRDPAHGFAGAARVLGAAAIACALVLPTVTPHLPTRFLIDGLGQSPNAVGSSNGEVRLSTTIDLSRSLNSQSTTPVLTYTTTDPSPPPLRVEVLSRFVDGVAVLFRPPAPPPADNPQIALPAGLPRDLVTKDDTYRISVTSNKLRPPQLATPYGTLGGQLRGAHWTVNAFGVAMVDSRTPEYTITYVHPTPKPALLRSSSPTLADPGVTRADLTVDPAAAQRVRNLVARIVPASADKLTAAMAIQRYLRGPDFTYSLQLAGPARDKNGRVMRLDPISNFLVTKQGYCQQFATAMVMMARAEGIPARLALGFLPGTVLNGERVVRASDAHAWPELYFQGVGWLRFEPTPAARTGVAPDYTASSPSGSPDAGSTAPNPTDSSGQANRPTDRNRLDVQNAEGTPVQPPLFSWQGAAALLRTLWMVPVGILVLLVAFAVPGAARWRRRRSAHHDAARRVEAQWQAMIGRIDDLGVSPPTGATPRQTGEYLRKRAYLEGEVVLALRRVVTTLENARYAAPGTPLDDISDETGTVVHAIGRSRRRRDRVRAWWLPQDGLAVWRDVANRTTAVPARWWVRVRTVLTDRRTG